MRKLLSSALVAMFVLLASSVHAQSVPDLSGSNWRLVSTEDRITPVVGIVVKRKIYVNSTENLRAIATEYKDKTVTMAFGINDDNSGSSAYWAINVDDRWYVAKSQGYHDVLQIAVLNNVKGEASRIQLGLDTTEGLKQVILEK